MKAEEESRVGVLLTPDFPEAKLLGVLVVIWVFCQS